MHFLSVLLLTLTTRCSHCKSGSGPPANGSGPTSGCPSIVQPNEFHTKIAHVNVFERWPGAFKAKVSVVTESDADQWEIHLKFAKQVKLFQVPKATYQRVDKNYFILRRRPWASKKLRHGERLEIEFIAYVQGHDVPCITAILAWKGDLGSSTTEPTTLVTTPFSSSPLTTTASLSTSSAASNILSRNCVPTTPVSGLRQYQAAVIHLEHEWQQKFKAVLTVSVPGNIRGWQIVLTFSKEIRNLQIWRAYSQTKRGKRIVLSNMSWNKSLKKGSELTMAFLASKTGRTPNVCGELVWGNIPNPTSQIRTTIHPSTYGPTASYPHTDERLTTQPSTNGTINPKPSTHDWLTPTASTHGPNTSPPLTDESSTLAKSTDGLLTPIPSTDQSVTTSATTTTFQSSTNEITTSAPSTDEQFTTGTPTDKAFTTLPSTDHANNSQPSTNKLTTSQPLATSQLPTDKLTTVQPSTGGLTTFQLSTDEASTSQPSTAESTTFQPSTNEATTSHPSNNVSTTPQSLTSGSASTQQSTSDSTTPQLPTDSTTQPFTGKPVTSNTSTMSTMSSLGLSTEEPTTFQPSNNVSTSSQPSPGKSATSQPPTGELTTLHTSTDNSATFQPSTNAVTTSQLSTDKPSTPELSTDRSTTSQPPTGELTTLQTSTDNSATSPPPTNEATTSQPSTDKLSTAQLITSGSTVSQPSTVVSTSSQLSTVGSTTVQPFTNHSTITSVNTENPSTAYPATNKVRTTPPSTSQPTTAAPTMSTNIVPQHCNMTPLFSQNSTIQRQFTIIILKDNWPDGFKATINATIPENIEDGWEIILSFSTTLRGLQVWRVIPNTRSGTRFVLRNMPWNRKLVKDTVLEVSFLAFKTTSLPRMCAVLIWKKSSHVTTLPTSMGSTSPPSSTHSVTSKSSAHVSSPNQSTAQSSPSPLFTTTPLQKTTLTTPSPTTDMLHTTRHILPSLKSTTKRVTHQSPYNYNEVLHKSILFYEAQRSGYLPSFNRIPWRENSATKDKGDNGEDLVGGWYDAGDHVKFGFPMAFSTTLLTWGLLQYHDAYLAVGELQNMLDCIKWPLDYFLKAHVESNVLYSQVGDGYLDHSYWGSAETMTIRRPAFKITKVAPGSDIAAETAAAMAAGSLAFRSTQPQYAQRLLKHAKELYSFADNYRGLYSQSISNAAGFYNSVSFKDELVWGALWLYKATEDKSYLRKAEDYFYSFSLSNPGWAFSWDEKTGGVQVLLYQLTNKQVYKDAIKATLNHWLPGGGITYTPKGLAWRLTWGPNRYAANTAFLALVAADTGLNPAEYRDFAKKQIHYMLGDSGRSFVVGFGKNPPVNPHHRGSSCAVTSRSCNINDPTPNPNVLYGALVGGPDKNDNYQDKRQDYIMNEVATDYNAGFQSAVSGLKRLEMKQN